LQASWAEEEEEENEKVHFDCVLHFATVEVSNEQFAERVERQWAASPHCPGIRTKP
jgi:hypothetical protein